MADIGQVMNQTLVFQTEVLLYCGSVWVLGLNAYRIFIKEVKSQITQ